MILLILKPIQLEKYVRSDTLHTHVCKKAIKGEPARSDYVQEEGKGGRGNHATALRKIDLMFSSSYVSEEAAMTIFI